MSLIIYTKPAPHQQEIQKYLAAALPNYKVKIPGFHPTKVVVRHDASRVVVSQSQYGLRVAGGVNTADLGVAVGIGIAVTIGIFFGAAARSVGIELLLGFLGYFSVYGIVHLSQKKKFTEMEQRVAKLMEERWPPMHK